MSALTNAVGNNPMRYDVDAFIQVAFSTNAVIDAAGEKVAFVGNVWHPTVKTGTINIRKVHFRLGATTFNVASVFRVSLQNISLTAGPPYQPDGTADQTAAMTTLTANAMNVTGALSADRAVNLANDSLGDADSRWLAVVFEETTFTAADSIIVSTYGDVSSIQYGLGGGVLLNTGTWALISNRVNNIVLECDDGTFAFLYPGRPYSALSSAAVSSTGAIRRAGVKFKYPTERKIDRFGLGAFVPDGCDGRLVLYDSNGTTELVSVNVDNDAVQTAGSYLVLEAIFEPVTLAANTFYRLAFVGSTATAVDFPYAEVAAVGHMDGLILGQSAHWTQADSGGTWTDTTTRRPHFAIGVSAVHDGVGGVVIAGTTMMRGMVGG